MPYTYTTQRALRKAFWAECKILPWKYPSGKYTVDVRCAFVDWIDMLCKSGEISEALAQRATL